MGTLRIGLEQDDGLFQASVDDTIELVLPENPTTGVRWAVDSLTGPLRLQSDAYTSAGEGGVGAASLRKLTFVSLGPGQATLRLKRRQEWEGDASVDATFSCSIDIGH